MAGQATVNPWTQPGGVYKQHYMHLVEHMDGAPIRRRCFAKSLITPTQNTRLMDIVDRASHNEILLGYLAGGCLETFVTFREILREYGGINLKQCVDDFDTIDVNRLTKAFGHEEPSKHESSSLTPPSERTCEVGAISAGANSGNITAQDAAIAKFEKHLLTLCELQRQRASALPAKLRRGKEDVCETFASLQAVNASDWQFSIHKPTSHTDAKVQWQSGKSSEADGRSTFILKDVEQLIWPKQDKAGGSDLAGWSRTGQSALPVICLIVSPPGGGKSTLCRRIMAQFTKDDSRLRQRFRFPIHIPCHESQRACSTNWDTLLGLDHDALRLTGDERKAIKDHLSDSSDHILFIIDGADEVGSSGFPGDSAIMSLLDGKGCILKASAVITSRPCQQAEQLIGMCDATHHFRLLGFSDTQLKSFCDSRLGKEEAARLMDQLSSDAFRLLKQTLQTTPLFMVLLCEHYRHSKVLPTSITELYTDMVKGAVEWLDKEEKAESTRRHMTLTANPPAPGLWKSKGDQVPMRQVLKFGLEHIVETSDPADNMKLTNGAIIKALQDLYQQSLIGLMTNQSFNLRSSSFQPETLDICSSSGLGLLSDFQPDEHIPKVSLPHPTIQEWCAARAVAQSEDPLSRARHCSEAFGMEEHTWPFWTFLIGQLPSEFLVPMAELLQSRTLSTGHSTMQRSHFQMFLMRCLYEHYATQHAFDDGPSSSVQERERLSEAATVIAKDGIIVSGKPLRVGDADILELTLRHASIVKFLDLSNSSISQDTIAVLGKSLRKARDLNLTSNILHGSPLATLVKALSGTGESQLGALKMPGCLLSADDGAQLARCIQLPTLEKLDLTITTLGRAGLEAISQNLTGSSSLTLLILSQCELPAGSGDILTLVLHHLPALNEVDVSKNKLSNADIASMLEALPHNSIRKVRLVNNGLDDGVLPAITGFLQRRHTGSGHNSSKDLTGQSSCQIRIGNNHLSPDFLGRIAESGQIHGEDRVYSGLHYAGCGAVATEDFGMALERSNGDLASEGITDELLKSGIPSIVSATRLTELDLGRNSISDVSAIPLAIHGLAGHQSIQVLDLIGNNIGFQGLSKFLEVLDQHNKTLRALCLSANPIFDGKQSNDAAFQRVIHLLPDCNSLRFLGLGSTHMDDNTASELLLALKQNQSLAVLSLSNNQLTDVIMSTLDELKRVNKSLRALSLAKNAITARGAKIAMESEAVRKGMKYVWMWGNKSCPPSTYSEPLLDLRLVASPSDILRMVC